MIIDFFEEFPSEKSLRKAKLIKFKSTVFLAAASYKEFNKAKQILNLINPSLEAGYWPTLAESYWISPFSDTKDLINLKTDLFFFVNQTKKPKVLLDLELPLLRKRLFIKNLFSFFKNRKLIESILKMLNIYDSRVYTAEYMFNSKTVKLLEVLGISYPIKKFKHEKILMYYTSFFKSYKFLNIFKKFRSNISNKYEVGLGILTSGIVKNEVPITPMELDRDFLYISRLGIKHVFIFRVEGLNEEYMKVINKYK